MWVLSLVFAFPLLESLFFLVVSRSLLSPHIDSSPSQACARGCGYRDHPAPEGLKASLWSLTAT